MKKRIKKYKFLNKNELENTLMESTIQIKIY